MKITKIIFIFIIFLPLILNPQPDRKNRQKGIYISPRKLAGAEVKMIEMVNIERAKIGLKQLVFDRKLKKTALKHNRKMAEMNKLSHTFENYPDLSGRLVKEDIYFESAGENIAFGSFYLPDYFHNGFMKSRQHRENILDKRFTHCGISLIETKKGFYVTQEFARIIYPQKLLKTKNQLVRFIQSLLNNKGVKSSLYLKNIEPYCQDYSSKLARGEKVKKLPPGLSGFGMIEIASPKLKNIREFISDTIEKNLFTEYAVYVRFSRIKKSPGGSYIFVMIYKLGKAYMLTKGDIEKNLLKSINKFLNRIGKRNILTDKRLTSYAKKINSKYMNHSSSIPRYRGITFTAYQTNSPYMIPGKLDSILKSSNLKGLLGLNIVKKGKNDAGENVFFICITWRM